MDYAIAIDVGGQSVSVALINSEGDIENHSNFSIIRDEPIGFEDFSYNLVKAIKEAKGYRRISGVGVGVPTPYDNDNLTFRFVHTKNYEGVNGYPLKDLILEAAECDVIYDEIDSVVAALGEIFKGEIVSQGRYMLLTLGTGLGGCYILDGKVVKGEDVGATESGEVFDYQFRGEEVEEFVGTTKSLIRIYREKGGTNKRILGGDIVYLSNMAREGDKIALDSFDEFGYFLGFGLVELIKRFNPKEIVLSGGIANSCDLFIDKANRILEEHIEGVSFRKSKLIDFSGLIGAGSKVFSNQL